MVAIEVKSDIFEELIAKVEKITEALQRTEERLNEPKFYTIKDVAKMLRCSEPTAQEIFNRADFPSCDFGKQKVIEHSAFVKYFSVPRRK